MDLDNVNDYTVRGSLWIEPIEGLTNVTIFDYYKSKTHGFGTVLFDVFPGNTLLAQLGIKSSFMENLAAQQARGPFVLDLPRSHYGKNRTDRKSVWWRKRV